MSSSRGYIKLQVVIALLILAITVYAADPPATASTGAEDASVSIGQGTKREMIANIQHDYNLKCGMCIGGGYDFCWKSDVGGKVLGPEDDPYHSSTIKVDKKKKTETLIPDLQTSQYICCKDEEDPNCSDIYQGDDDFKQQWICSFSFDNTAYSLHICPFIRDECGPNSIINFYQEGQDGAIHIKNLDKGDACVYNIQSVCGAPAVRINNGTGTQIFYSEWQQDAIPLNTPRNQLPFDSPAVKTSSPAEGMPIRNQQFVFYQDSEDIETDRAPLYGIHKQIGWKSWGNKKQDADSEDEDTDQGLGRRYAETDNVCSLRNMQVAVISMQDDIQMLLEVESQKFAAIYLNQSIAALLSILCMYYI